MRPHEVKKVSNGGSGINSHYSAQFLMIDPVDADVRTLDTVAKTELLYPKNWGAKEAMDSTLNEYLAPRAIEKKLKFWGLELKVI